MNIPMRFWIYCPRGRWRRLLITGNCQTNVSPLCDVIGQNAKTPGTGNQEVSYISSIIALKEKEREKKNWINSLFLLRKTVSFLWLSLYINALQHCHWVFYGFAVDMIASSSPDGKYHVTCHKKSCVSSDYILVWLLIYEAVLIHATYIPKQIRQAHRLKIKLLKNRFTDIWFYFKSAECHT